MIKKSFFFVGIGLVVLFVVIYAQVFWAKRTIKTELQSLAQINTTLFETRTLLSSLDEYIHPVEKISQVNLSVSKLKTLEIPSQKKSILNPLGLQAVDEANSRRLALQSVKQQIPEFISKLQILIEQLDKVFSALNNYLEYEPTYDLYQRSIVENPDEFKDRLKRAQTGISKTLEKVRRLKLPNNQKETIITSIVSAQLILENLIEATEKNKIDESNQLRAEFIETINYSRVEIDQLIAEIGGRLEIIEQSRALSITIENTLQANY